MFGGKVNFQAYTDANGLIVQKDQDGGDTAGREGDFWFYNGLMFQDNYNNPEFNRVLELLQVEPGIFVRNPVNYNNPKDFSRDQTVPLILAMGENNRQDLLKVVFEKQVRRFFLYQNNDIGLPEDLNYYIRAFKYWPAYPLLLIGDFQMLINSIFRCIIGRDLNNVSDDINHTLVLIQAQKYMPTPISWLARKVYKWFRPGGVLRAWQWYFRTEAGGNPFHELYKDLINDL